MPPAQSQPRRGFYWLAILSWLPFAVALFLVFDGNDTAQVVHFTVVYGAAALCFLGGVRLGANLLGGPDMTLVVQLAPLLALVGLLALALPEQVALAVLVVGFGAQGALDVWAGMQGRLPRNYVAARSLMTWLCALTLMGILVALGWS